MIETTDLDALRAESDDDLLARYQQSGNQAAFTELEHRYHGRMLAHACRYRGGVLRAQAEEIVQDAFLAFFKRYRQYAPRTTISTLLYTIVTNKCRNRVKHAKREKRACHLTRSLRERDPADPKSDPRRHETKMDLDDMLGTLSPEKAEAVRLMRIDGHTAESAAELVKVSPEAMRKRERRGLDALKELVAPLVVLLAIIGSVADGCEPDVYLSLSTAESDEDEVFREDSRHHESNKLCRKNLMQLPIWPDTVEVHPNMPRVVNARHEDYDVLIARPSKWGNPFQIGRGGDRERVIRMYEVHIRRRPDLPAALPELAGKRLGCYCKPEACHGDVLVKLFRELFLEV